MIKPLSILKGLILLLCMGGASSCNDEGNRTNESAEISPTKPQISAPIFERVDPKASGLDFYNNLTETAEYNYFKFQYSFNGAGLAIGDLNGDGLHDVYLVGNQVQDKLYINQGELKFKDITSSAGIKDQGGFHFGVTMVDIDDDNDLDIYVSVSGHGGLGSERNNLLYINNGDLTFTESAEQWGLADNGHSIQSAFFDYDQDGDLDMYLTNHPIDFGQNLKERLEKMKNPAAVEKDKLYRNNGDMTYSDVTDEAGLRNYGHGLGLVIWDINEDGWDDIYVANDYQSTDYVYVNNADGTFTDRMTDYFPHIPYYSMGVDVGDLNNDGLLDVNVVEMLPENYARRMLNLTDLTERNYYTFNKVGFHHQYLRNCLSINTGMDFFSDRALMTGTEATDWSWATLIADFDNDGQQDIFTSNGYLRDMQDKDYQRKAVEVKQRGGRLDMDTYNSISVSKKIKNYLFRNKGELEFESIAKQAGLGELCFSAGAAYADLDKDGDLELLVNNVNLQLAPDPVFLYENLSNDRGSSLSITLNGAKGNSRGEGAKVILRQGEDTYTRVLRTTRGYLSSVPPELYFGLAHPNPIDELTVIWPDGSFEVKTAVAIDRPLTLNHSDAGGVYSPTPTDPMFKEIDLKGLDFVHDDKILNEYDLEMQLPYRLGMQGPGGCTGDVNGDGLDDIYITATHEHSDKLYLQTSSGFKLQQGPWEQFAGDEHICAAYSDIDLDGDLDLYVGSGGVEQGRTNEAYIDKLFINDGQGNFSYEVSSLPRMMSSTSCIVFGDMDGDGDQDAFVGSRSIPGKYGDSPRSFLLRNDGGVFHSVASELAPSLRDIGMVSDASWYDVEMDGDLDLVIVGEWSSPSLLINETGKLTADHTTEVPDLKGLYRSVTAADIDGDGSLELLLGNAGLNTKYQVSSDQPLRMYTGDLDDNGTRDIMLAYPQGKLYHPDRSLSYLMEQFPAFNRRYPYYADFLDQDLTQLFGTALAEADVHEAGYLASCVLKLVDGKYQVTALPDLAQVSYSNAIIAEDLDQDGDLDLIVAGNELYTPIQTGSSDASIGAVFINDGVGGYKALAAQQAGLRLDGWIKGMKIIDYKGSRVLLAWRNNDRPLAYELNTMK